MSQKETPAELFKRSLAQTTRALAGQEGELEVAFGAEGPKLAPGRIVLPHPPRVISDPEAERCGGRRMRWPSSSHNTTTASMRACGRKARKRARSTTASRKCASRPSAPTR